MKRVKKWMSAAMALTLLLQPAALYAQETETEFMPVEAGQLTAEDLEALGAEAYVHDGRVTFVDGACTDRPVQSMEDAAQVVEAMTGLLGGDERTQFEPWREFEDTAANHYYVFQQMYADTTVSGGAVKVITDPDGTMIGLSGSVEGELPEVQESEGITAEKAEELVLAHLEQEGYPQTEILAERTEQIILPVNLELDPDSEEEKEESRFVWAVYTANPGADPGRGSELPYLAHYVTMDGTYLYSLPTIVPGDEAAASGYDAAYLFEFMEPAEYTGTVTLSDGTEKEITVTLMQDVRTGMYYMGNVERRIAVADCHPFIYDGGRVVLEASPDNTGWDDTCLLSLYNYCLAWDYYQEIGWNGGDGVGTPILVLKDFCTRDHKPVNNAAYAGKYYGWQLFLSSSANDFSQCLDVLGHEFTHCVTGSVMTYNAYMNDYGAINEAMSDIQGNLCEMYFGATEDTTWEIGENSAEHIRSMSEPHKYSQPEYAWDLYYVPKVKTPTDLNDRGGVHGNSSLLNNVAYRLCADGGMTIEEARAYWFAVDCTMVPGTDYAQLSDMLPWVLENQGLEKYAGALESAMDATRIRTDAVPDFFDQDRAMVTLTLPDTEMFSDGNWALGLVTVDTDAIMQRAGDIFSRTGEYASALDELVEMMGIDPAVLPTAGELEEDPEHAWDRLAEALENMTAETDAEGGAAADAQDGADKAGMLTEWFGKYFGEMFYAATGAAGQDGRTVRMVCRPGTTVPVLFRMKFDPDMNLESGGLAVYTLGTWFDLGTFLAPMEMSVPEEVEAEAETEELDLSWLGDFLGLGGEDSGEGEEAGLGVGGLVAGLLGGAASLLFKMDWFKDLIFFKIAPGQITEIPSAGLEDVQAVNVDDYPGLAEMFTMAETEPETEAQSSPETAPETETEAAAGFAYEHDPRENPEAMEDILENPEAVYGFSPDPASERLGSFAEYDWTDPEFVAEARAERLAYHESVDSMTDILYEMREQGASIEEMARAVSEERNRIRLASYENDPEGLAAVKESNLKSYGHEEGPTPDELFEKYGSWTTVLQKAFGTNMGMDACCGLYDEFYWLYIELGYVE